MAEREAGVLVREKYRKMLEKADRLKCTAQALRDVCMTMSTAENWHEDNRRKAGMIDGKDTNIYTKYEGSKGDSEQNTALKSSLSVPPAYGTVSGMYPVITGDTTQAGGNVDFETDGAVGGQGSNTHLSTAAAALAASNPVALKTFVA